MHTCQTKPFNFSFALKMVCLKFSVLGVFVAYSAACVKCEYEVPQPSIEVSKPKGFRVSIPDEEGIQLFAFHGAINRELDGLEAGDMSKDVLKKRNGRWTFHERKLKLKKGDTLYYWLFVIKDGLGYRLDDGIYTFKDGYRKKSGSYQGYHQIQRREAITNPGGTYAKTSPTTTFVEFDKPEVYEVKPQENEYYDRYYYDPYDDSYYDYYPPPPPPRSPYYRPRGFHRRNAGYFRGHGPRPPPPPPPGGGYHHHHHGPPPPGDPEHHGPPPGPWHHGPPPPGGPGHHGPPRGPWHHGRPPPPHWRDHPPPPDEGYYGYRRPWPRDRGPGRYPPPRPYYDDDYPPGYEEGDVTSDRDDGKRPSRDGVDPDTNWGAEDNKGNKDTTQKASTDPDIDVRIGR